MELKDIPRRVFLDTCVVNFILDHGEYIFDGIAPSNKFTERSLSDAAALYNLFFVGKRAMWQLAISPHTYQEVAATKDPQRCYYLERWFGDLWQYWQDIIHEDDDLPNFSLAEDLRAHLLSSGELDCLTDVADRVLVCDAIVYNCELFCTRDWTTILRHRKSLHDLPIHLVTPTEWWAKVRPFAKLWA